VKYTVPMKARKNKHRRALEISFRVTRVFEAGAAVRVMQGSGRWRASNGRILSASGWRDPAAGALLRGLSPRKAR
jgi:hypothetical protein